MAVEHHTFIELDTARFPQIRLDAFQHRVMLKNSSTLLLKADGKEVLTGWRKDTAGREAKVNV